jgi:tripeptide aminopeptidase
VNRERLERTFLELCRIPSPSGREGAVAAYIRRRLEAAGYVVEVDGAGAALGSDTGNLIVRTPGAGGDSGPGESKGYREPLFLSAHMDTVPVPDLSEIPVEVTNGVAHTDGSSVLGGDDKAGVAVAMELLESRHEGMRPLEVAFTVQEELGARGAGYLRLQAFRSGWGFNLDGEGPVYSAIRRAPSKYRYAVRVNGRRSHAAVEPREGRNALLAAAEVALKLPQGLLDDDSTGNVAAIEGGGATNIVPGEAVIRGEIRSLRPERLQELREGIERAADLASYRDGISATVEWEHLYDGYELTEEDPPVRAFLDACAALTGEGGTLLESKGGGDANPINNKGISVIVFGLGMENIHTTEERMELKNLSLATALLERILTR